MAGWRAAGARSETRVTCERRKQKVRERCDSKFWVEVQKASNLEPSSVSPVPLFPPVSLESEIGDCSRNVYE